MGAAGLLFSPDNKFVAAPSGDDEVGVWKVADGELQATLTGHSGPLETVRWGYRDASSDVLITSGKDDSTVRLWDFTGR